VVIGDFDLVSPFISPTKAESVFIADPNGMLTRPVSDQGMQLIAGWTFKVIDCFGGIEISELPARRRKYTRRKLFGSPTFEYVLGRIVGIALDHAMNVGG
jgi:hypothetical protein